MHVKRVANTEHVYSCVCDTKKKKKLISLVNCWCCGGRECALLTIICS